MDKKQKVLKKDELPPHKRSYSPEEKSTDEPSSTSEDQDETIQSANNWEQAELGGDEDRKAKFLRLMGAAKKEHKGRFVIGSTAVVAKPHARTSEEEKNLEEKLESQYQHRLSDHLQHRHKKHRGLGFDQVQCPECSKTFSDEGALKIHHHAVHSKETGEGSDTTGAPETSSEHTEVEGKPESHLVTEPSTAPK